MNNIKSDKEIGRQFLFTMQTIKNMAKINKIKRNSVLFLPKFLAEFPVACHDG